MDAVAIRNAFLSFAGEQRYRRFIRQLNMTCHSLGRLRYWQEDLWSNFVRLNPEYGWDLKALFAAFRICDIHGEELALITVEVLDGQIHYDGDFNLARAKLFPYTPIGTIRIPGELVPTRRAEVWCCPGCQEAARTWQPQHRQIS